MTHQVLKITDFNFSQFEILSGLVSPELADELLKRNIKNNRKIGMPTVNGYIQQMNEGQWFPCDPIKFNEQGELFDGQHRLTAAIKTGKPQFFIIGTCYPKETARVVDQGKKRTAKDIAQISGKVLGHVDISIFRMIYLMANNPTNSSWTPVFPPQNVVSACLIYKERLDFACSYSGKKNAIRYAPVLSAVFAAYPYENHQRLLEFLECWHSGVVVKGLGDNAAIALLRAYEKNISSGGSSARIDFFCKAQSAVKAFLKHQSLDHIKGTSKLVWNLDEFKRENLIQKIKEFDING